MSNKISSKKAIFFDFDGVIKESVEVKSDAFEQLFSIFSPNVIKKVRQHHEANGGMSRFDKIPLYLTWAGVILSNEIIESYLNRFSDLVKQNVIDSDWVPGVVNYLQNYTDNQMLFIVTATPQLEIEEIITALGVAHFFCKIVGAPTKKTDALRILIEDYQVVPKQAAMIGDSISDYQAASANAIPFILRKTKLNKRLKEELNCQMIDDFSHE
jgi:phosphoglycolate phosphatase-like HAD superfamily hydrolase